MNRVAPAKRRYDMHLFLAPADALALGTGVACPACAAKAGVPCRMRSGLPIVDDQHMARLALAVQDAAKQQVMARSAASRQRIGSAK